MGELEPAGDGGELVPPGELRASYADRDRVAETLRVAAGDGRLTAEELDQRLEKALTARTYGELAALTRDLPADRSAPAAPREMVRIDCGSSVIRRDGRWVVPRRLEIQVTSGTVTLDFTDAAITQPSLDIEADVRSGRLTLITRPGMVVDTDDVAVSSGVVKVTPPGQVTPRGGPVPEILRVRVSGRVASGVIQARPPRRPRRSFWAWLLRRPRRRSLPA